MTTAMLGLGIVCNAVAFFVFLALHSWADVSFVLPATALGYSVKILGAQYLLQENVTTARWIGTIFICIGVALISFKSGVK
jgi:transporter family protein